MMTGTFDFETVKTIRENRQIVRHVELDLAITLNTREQLSRSCLQKRVHEFERRLNKKIFGKNWRQRKKRINWIHNYEHTSGNSHSHSVCMLEGVEAKAVKRHARQVWANLNKGKSQAQLWADTITNPNATAIYITKDGDMDTTPV
jgi:hypothetical protein